MRVRLVVLIVALLLPAALEAQRVPRARAPIGRPTPVEPADLPPQAPEVARLLAYRRLRVSIESYPMASWFQAPGLRSDRPQPAWTTFGAGTRVDYRITRFVSATLDLTSSYFGGPVATNTAELGTRLHRERTDSRAYPFIDLRAGYASAHLRTRSGYNGTFGESTVGFGQQSQGFGAIAGVGMEYALTRMFSLTTAASLLRTRMTTNELGAWGTTPRSFGMTSARYTLGLRYNPVRLVMASETR